MITLRDSFNFLSSAALLACSWASAELEVSLRPTTIQAGNRTVLEIRLPIGQYRKSTLDTLRLNDRLLKNHRHFRVLERESYREEDHWVWQIYLTSYSVGTKAIPPLEIVAGPETFSTERIALNVETTRAVGDYTLRSGFDAVELPWTVPPWVWRLVAAAILLALLIYGVWRWLPRFQWKRKEAPAPVAIVEVNPESDADWLKRHLAQLRKRMEANPGNQALVDELTQILRGYYARRSGRPAKAWTTRELFRRLPHERTLKALEAVFQRCDSFKFTGRATTPERFLPAQLHLCEQILL